MLAAPRLAQEAERLAALRASEILDTPSEERFDRVTRLLSHLLGAPIAMVSLVDEDRLWFKSRLGMDSKETARDTSFCGHAIAGEGLFEVSDASNDGRFHDNPLVAGHTGLRYYAGVPLHGPTGHKIGTLCALDRKPRKLTEKERALVGDLAAIVEREMQLTDITELQHQVIETQAEAERLLLCILPQAIAQKLRSGPTKIAEHFQQATVLFGDIEGFTDLAATLPAKEMVDWLNVVFSELDVLVASHGVEKIKTIGDAYMAVAGVPTPRTDQVEAIAALAMAMQGAVGHMRRPDGSPLRLRIGIHTGPVIAGVIGTTKFAYDLWGHTVNIASRLEFAAPPGNILVSDAVHAILKHKYRFEQRQTLTLKGVGSITAYLLKADA